MTVTVMMRLTNDDSVLQSPTSRNHIPVPAAMMHLALAEYDEESRCSISLLEICSPILRKRVAFIMHIKILIDVA